MIRIEKCPLCKCQNLKVIKKYCFIIPEKKVYDELTGDLAFWYERLLIFFENILKNRNPAEFDIQLCKSCGMIFSNPRFTEEEIRVAYGIVSELESAKRRIKKKPPSKTDERARRIYTLIAGLQENKPKSKKILDYGGAKGYNLLPFVAKGNYCYVLDYVKYDNLKGIKYLGKHLSDLPDDEVFDVILLCHVLEHATEPKCMINGLLSHLAEKGLLYVEVPLGCWKEWKYLLQPLSHINFFSEESIYMCLRNAGLNIIHLSTAYQHVLYGKMWCINIVGCRQERNTITEFKTTSQQKENPYYYLKYFMENPGYYLMRLTKRLLKI